MDEADSAAAKTLPIDVIFRLRPRSLADKGVVGESRRDYRPRNVQVIRRDNTSKGRILHDSNQAAATAAEVFVRLNRYTMNSVPFMFQNRYRVTEQVGNRERFGGSVTKHPAFPRMLGVRR